MAAPATSSKKKQKKKGKTLNLTEFLGDSSGPGASYVLANKPVSWADEVENQEDAGEDMGDYGTGSGRVSSNVNRAALPTAPRAARGPDVDMEMVPTEPPFTAFLGNLPFDVDEDEIEKFFSGLEITNIRIPPGRTKGFGYAEFADRQTLINALSLNDEMIRNRKIRIDLADQHQGDRDKDRGFDRGGRDRGLRDDDGRDPDRAESSSDWRRKDPSEDRFGGDRGSGSRFASRDIRYYDKDENDGRESWGRGGDRGYGDRDRGFGDRDRGYADRDRGYGDRDRGFGGDRDRGYGDRDRGYGGDRGYGRDRDRGYGGDRGYGSDRGRYDDRDGYGGGRKSFGSGFRNDRDRYGRDDRYGYRDRYSDRGYERDRYPPRHDDLPNESTEPTNRPRLKLKPRTKPVEEAGKPAERSSSIFGSAKPVDTATREREIEERLIRQRETEGERWEQENRARDRDRDRDRISSSTSDSRDPRGSRSRQDSDSDRTSVNGPSSGGRRERKLSSSSSGKGIRTVAPPPGVGSARVRRDSTLSDNEDVFEDDKGTSPKSSSARKEDTAPTKLVPAPPPAVNVWAKRKEQHQSTASSQSTSSQEKQDLSLSPKEIEDSNKENKEHPKVKQNVSPAPKESAWSRGKPEFIPAEPPKENVWAKRQQDLTPPKKEDDGSFSGSHWGNNKTRGGASTGSSRGRGRGQGDGTPRGRGSTTDRSRSSRERPIPKSVAEMPKYEEHVEKDWSDKNKFSTLMGDEDGAVYSDE